MSPQVAASFWMCVKESALLAPEVLADIRRDPATRSLAPRDVARVLVQRRLLSRFQADRLLEGRSRGFFFDNYKIVDMLGVGGMGTVYQAQHTVSGDVVALKVLGDRLKRDDGMRARFLQEARIGLRLQHPQIVRTYELGSAGGLPYMIMELVRGPSLLEILLRVHRVPWAAACEFARQAALGLEYAHRQGFIHRDVKPQNLLIDDACRVRLLDFGLAMSREGESGDEFSMAMIFGHQSVGTAEYASPEQMHDSLAADARSDVYSLGATLFTALTGTTPFQADTTAEMLQAHHTQRLRSVREYTRSIPAEVADIVAKMMARNPRERFQSAADAAAALAPWSKTVPVEFDFDMILAERKQHARERQAQLSQESQPAAPGIGGSTARPAQGSSVAQAPAVRSTSSKVSLRKVDAAGIPTDAATPSRPPADVETLGTLTSLQSGESFALTQDRLLIGRGAECQLQVDDAAVSSRHCELRFDGYRWWLNDLHSRNGTSVNGVAVRQHELQSGDEISVGSRAKFRIGYGAESRPQQRSLRAAWIVAAAMIAGASLLAGVITFWW
ncbi:MAG: protein kinase [Planctomycetaceae bacterium]|nr:protein kinase [Planctomycetaceae bacterium]